MNIELAYIIDTFEFNHLIRIVARLYIFVVKGESVTKTM